MNAHPSTQGVANVSGKTGAISNESSDHFSADWVPALGNNCPQRRGKAG